MLHQVLLDLAATTNVKEGRATAWRRCQFNQVISEGEAPGRGAKRMAGGIEFVLTASHKTGRYMIHHFVPANATQALFLGPGRNAYAFLLPVNTKFSQVRRDLERDGYESDIGKVLTGEPFPCRPGK